MASKEVITLKWGLGSGPLFNMTILCSYEQRLGHSQHRGKTVEGHTEEVATGKPREAS